MFHDRTNFRANIGVSQKVSMVFLDFLAPFSSQKDRPGLTGLLPTQDSSRMQPYRFMSPPLGRPSKGAAPQTSVRSTVQGGPPHAKAMRRHLEGRLGEFHPSVSPAGPELFSYGWRDRPVVAFWGSDSDVARTRIPLCLLRLQQDTPQKAGLFWR